MPGGSERSDQGIQAARDRIVGHPISHESHHRGEIKVILTRAGHPLDKKTSFGLREWDVR